MKKIFNNGLIWFGAALSIAEIKTGTSFASLGFSKGLSFGGALELAIAMPLSWLFELKFSLLSLAFV